MFRNLILCFHKTVQRARIVCRSLLKVRDAALWPEDAFKAVVQGRDQDLAGGRALKQLIHLGSQMRDAQHHGAS